MSLEQKIKTIRAGFEGLRADMAATRSEADKTEKHLSDRAGRMRDNVKAAADETLSNLGSVDREAQNLFDAIESNLGNNEWDEELRRRLGEVRDGTTTLGEFKQLWGDTMVDVGRGQERIATALDRLDPRTFKQKAAEIRQAIRDESIGIEETIGLLNETTTQHLARLRELVKAWQENRANIEDVIRAAEQAKRSVGADSTAGAIADGLGSLLREAQRQGGY